MRLNEITFEGLITLPGTHLVLNKCLVVSFLVALKYKFLLNQESFSFDISMDYAAFHFVSLFLQRLLTDLQTNWQSIVGSQKRYDWLSSK